MYAPPGPQRSGRLAIVFTTRSCRCGTVHDVTDDDTAAHVQLTRTRASFAAQAAMRELAVRIAALEPGRIELHFPHDARFTQQHGFLHAGVLSTVMDSACGYAAFSLMHPDASVLTVSYQVNLLRPARADEYRVVGEVIRAGRTITVARSTAHGADGAGELAVMTGTLMALVGSSIREEDGDPRARARGRDRPQGSQRPPTGAGSW
jgi:uncharacterized protein (TIGR00369 family)